MAYHSNGYSGDEREMSRSDDRIQDEMDKPTYLMEHLATFTVNKETGITYPADGMRRLLQLEKTNGIWSQKMQLCLDRSWVLIMDYETGTIMERFPAKSVIEPTAFTSQDPMEMYNNILVFIVTNSNPQHPPEMHIFQCQSISAQDLVEDLKEIQKGRILTRNRRTSIPPPSMKPPPQHVNASREYRESDSELTTNNDDNSSTTSEQYERDVTVLNHCFDDIEKFIARLQHAAAASRELERRRRSRKSKKSDNGDGMLTMRTKPPLEKEFVDIFQKFKLSFNLLAKLKAHIHDPNAPELVHFLFTPLALIVEAAHDTYFDLHIPHNVVSPLLTREAINLLINCVTSKETELWHSLGNAWLIPRNEWKGHVSTYHPVFLDKWSPDYPVVDELEPNKHYRDPHNEGQYSDDEYDPSMQDNMFMMENQRGESHHDSEPKMDHREHSGHEMASGARSDISADSIERNGGMGSGMSGPPDERSFKRLQENFLLMLQKQNALIVQVTYPRTANNDKELTVVRGEYLEVLDDTRKWWRARNHKGEIAHVPHTIVSRYNGQSDIYPNPIYRESASDRLSPSGPDHPPPAPPVPADLVRRERQGFAPPAPAPPPPPSVDYNNSMRVPSAASLQNVQLRPTNAQPARPKSARNGLWAAANVNDELSAIFQLMEDKKRNDIDIKPTPGVYISAKSSPADVQEWLKAKKFEGEIITTLKGKNGKEMFKLAQQPSELFNSPDGKRLQSQLKLQMSVCGYQTVRVSEFKQILERARNRADTSM